MWYEFGLIATGALLAALWVIGRAGLAFANIMSGIWILALFGLVVIAGSAYLHACCRLPVMRLAPPVA